MFNDPTFTPARPRVRRRKRVVSAPAALTLVGASYHEAGTVTLVFDRAIDLTNFDPAQILVDDGEYTGWRMEGAEPVNLLSPTTVQLSLVEAGTYGSPDIRLTASDQTGIEAVDGGEQWAGVTGMVLPYP